MSMADVVTEATRHRIPLVELTGCEPLAQDGTPALIAALFDAGSMVLLETSGSEPIDRLDPRTHIIMDLKCPDSGMADRNLWSNLGHLKATDEIKFVLASRADFDWAMMMIQEHHLERRFRVLMSCAWGHVQPKDLAQWMVENPIDARLQLQQHKYIWSPRAKGV